MFFKRSIEKNQNFIFVRDSHTCIPLGVGVGGCRRFYYQPTPYVMVSVSSCEFLVHKLTT